MKFQKINKYQIIDIIGKGSMGVVYKCIDTVLNRYVALKTMNIQLMGDENLKNRFYREAKILAELNHPNIVQVYELKEYENLCYIVMEYVEGESLKHVIESKKPLSTISKLEIVRQIASGVSYAHSKGVIHRNLKPANIIIREDGVTKILDFGVAKLKTSSITSKGSVLGTIAYMAPEQLKGEQIDERVDIFAIGVIMYEMFSYKKPFNATGITEVMYKIVNKMPDYIPRANKDINYIIFKSLAKNPEERYKSAEQLMEAVEELIKKQNIKKEKIKNKMDFSITTQIKKVQKEIEKMKELRNEIEEHLLNAKQLLKQEKLKKAIEEAKAVLELDNANQDAEAIIEKANRLLVLKQEEEKMKAKWVKERLTEANHHFNSGNLIKACEISESILKIDPSNHDARVIKSICIKKIKEFLKRIE